MTKNPYREERDFLSIHDERMDRIASCYVDTGKKGATGEGLTFDQLKNRVQDLDDPSVEGNLEVFRQFITPDDIFKGGGLLSDTTRMPIVLAAAYLWRAKCAYLVNGRIDVAWSYLADGCYWAGFAVSSRGGKRARKEERVSIASMGAQVRKEKYRLVKEHAINLLRSRMPPEKWENFFVAASDLDKGVNDFADKVGLGAIAADTIYEWISKVPDADSLSQGKRRERKLKSK